MSDPGTYCFALLCVMPNIIMSVIMTNQIGQARNNTMVVRNEQLDVIRLNWAEPLFNDVFTVDQNQRCEDQDGRPILNFVWMGAEHMCVNSKREAFLGASCQARSLLYRKDGDDDPVRTDYNDYPGFPMVQQSVFNGKRFCGKMIKELPQSKSQAEYVTVKDHVRSYTGGCPATLTRDCGNNLCISLEAECPISEIKIVKKDEIPSGFKSVDFDGEYSIAFHSDKKQPPITQARLEIEQPCMNSFYQSGTTNQDNSIYQIWDYNFHTSDDGLNVADTNRYTIHNIQIVSNEYNDLDKYSIEKPTDFKFKCPSYLGTYQDDDYTSAGQLPLNLKQIYEENGVYNLMKGIPFFDQGIFDQNEKIKPKLWVKQAIQSNLECDIMYKTREEVFFADNEQVVENALYESYKLFDFIQTFGKSYLLSFFVLICLMIVCIAAGISPFIVIATMLWIFIAVITLAVKVYKLKEQLLVAESALSEAFSSQNECFDSKYAFSEKTLQDSLSIVHEQVAYAVKVQTINLCYIFVPMTAPILYALFKMCEMFAESFDASKVRRYALESASMIKKYS